MNLRGFGDFRCAQARPITYADVHTRTPSSPHFCVTQRSKRTWPRHAPRYPWLPPQRLRAKCRGAFNVCLASTRHCPQNLHTIEIASTLLLTSDPFPTLMMYSGMTGDVFTTLANNGPMTTIGIASRFLIDVGVEGCGRVWRGGKGVIIIGTKSS